MICKKCMVVMGTGTTYEQKKENNEKRSLTYRRFYQCPKCQSKVYSNSSNFQEILAKVSEKNRSK